MEPDGKYMMDNNYCRAELFSPARNKARVAYASSTATYGGPPGIT
jgi:hypothetical protein